jgi:hypothetical protein
VAGSEGPPKGEGGTCSRLPLSIKDEKEEEEEQAGCRVCPSLTDVVGSVVPEGQDVSLSAGDHEAAAWRRLPSSPRSLSLSSASISSTRLGASSRASSGMASSRCSSDDRCFCAAAASPAPGSDADAAEKYKPSHSEQPGNGRASTSKFSLFHAERWLSGRVERGSGRMH